LSVPVLATVGGLYVQFTTALTSLSLPALTSVSGILQVYDNAALTNVSLPALTSVSGDFQVTENTALTSMSLPVLTTVGGVFRVENSFALPACQAQAVRDQLISFAETTTISGNDDAGTCP
jgi:hypothetical protein